MKKEGWIRFAVEITPNELMMLDNALKEEGVNVVYQPTNNSNSRGASLSRNYCGSAFFISESQKFLAKKVITGFFVDFDIDKSKLVIG